MSRDVGRKSTPAATDGTPAKGTAAKGTPAKTAAAKSTEAAVDGAADAGAVRSGQSYLTPAAAKAQLRLLWSVEHDILKRVFGALDLVVQATRYEHPTDIFFLDVLPVPPSRFRPVSGPASPACHHSICLVSSLCHLSVRPVSSRHHSICFMSSLRPPRVIAA